MDKRHKAFLPDEAPDVSAGGVVARIIYANARIRGVFDKMIVLDKSIRDNYSTLTVFELTTRLSDTFAENDYMIAVKIKEYSPAVGDIVLETGHIASDLIVWKCRLLTYSRFRNTPVVISKSHEIEEISPERKEKMYVVLRHIKN